ncbi:MAG: tetratricopeptide repeat protein [Bacteroidota bacterium]
MKRRLLCALFLLVFFPIYNYSQSTQKSNPELILEELALLKQAHNDQEKLDVFVELAALYRKNNAALAEAYSDSTIILSQKLKQHKTYWLGLNSKAEALRVKGELEKALKIHQAAFTYAESNKLTKKSAHSLNNIGLVLKRQENLKAAQEYIMKAREIYKSINDTDGIMTTSTNLGNCLLNLEIYDQALKHYNEVISLALPRNDFSALGNAYTNTALIYYYTNKKKESKDYYFKALLYREKAGVPGDIANSYGDYGYMLYEEGKNKEANEFYKKALNISKQVGDRDRTSRIYSYMKEMAVTEGDFKKAYFLLDTVRSYKDSIINETNISSLNEMSQKFDSEKKQLSIEKLSVENNLKAKENKMQRTFLMVVGIALVIAIVMGIIVYKQYKAKHTANKIIVEQKEALQEKQKEILDSITYAKRIQHALLASEELLNNHLSDYFILFKPKDIVSGDFYWASSDSEGVFYLAVCDSTGHGVPGAFMSLLNISFLNESLTEKKLKQPNEILNHTRTRLIQSLKSDGSEEGGKDGMDCTLLAFDIKNNMLEYSAANNGFYIMRDNELIKFAADKMPVGKSPKDEESFTSRQVTLQKGDIIYLLTDGYPDQFGGDKGKKYKYKQLEDLLLTNGHLPMEQQKLLLDQSFENWRGSLEQIDDVLLVGIRV